MTQNHLVVIFSMSRKKRIVHEKGPTKRQNKDAESSIDIHSNARARDFRKGT